MTFSTPPCARAATAIFALSVVSACSRGAGATADTAAASASSANGTADSAMAATPVHMAVVTRGNIAIMVSGPGRTDALDLQKIRAPFAGTLTSLQAVVGEHVGTGQVIGSIVSQPSQAAVTGAQSMLGNATTPAEKSDAERALMLARQNLVATPLRVSRGGTVIARGASQGDLVSQGDSIVSIAAAGSIVFIARIAQGDLAHVRPGQRATIALPGETTPARGIVRGLLPADTSGGMTVPVRIDLQGSPRAAGAPVQTGLFGTAQIIVGEHTQVPTVPAEAVLRDDISGVSRVALVTAKGEAHWVTVTVGATEGDRVEITSPPFTPGQRVIVSGQVGLPEGSRVREGDSNNSDGSAPASAANRASANGVAASPTP
ncbi:MAG: HlyD family efflux transporter periplasmic adaptor subunit [Gemmatimonadaceae bacterium]